MSGAALDAFATETEMVSNAAFVRRGLDAAGLRRSHDHTSFGSDSPVSEPESLTFPELAGLSMQTLDQQLDDIDPRALALPPRPFADDMLRVYWQNYHSIFPFLHWPTFQRKYRALWKTARVRLGFAEILFQASLNMVLALACLRNDGMTLEERQYHASEFYKRSVKLVSVESLEWASIEIVQMLLLRAMYLYFAGRPDPCWLISGAAIRMATGINLNLTPPRKLNQLEREMRRRVWYGGCIALDGYVNDHHYPRFGMVTMPVVGSSRALSAEPARSTRA